MKFIPHPIPYQGSKRILAPKIAKFMRHRYRRVFEPFAGSAAFSLFAASHDLGEKFILGDSLAPLIALWKSIVLDPDYVSERYSQIWQGQEGADAQYFTRVREEYNEIRDPVLLYYLVARCVKNAVRFSKDGRFTQSADKRRKGMSPDKVERNVKAASALLRGRAEFFAGDYRECLSGARPGDLVYLDPPYQGTTYGRDKRYFEQVDFDDLCGCLRELNRREVSFLLSYDGSCGDKSYGQELPADVEATRISLNAGRSSQATLSGRDAFTTESLYISSEFRKTNGAQPREAQLILFQSGHQIF